MSEGFKIVKKVAVRTTKYKYDYPVLEKDIIYSKNSLFELGFEDRHIEYCITKGSIETVEDKGIDVSELLEIIEMKKEETELEKEEKRKNSVSSSLNQFDYGELYKVVIFGIQIGFNKEQILKEAEGRLINSLEWKLLNKKQKEELIDYIFENKNEILDDTIIIETELNFNPIIHASSLKTDHLLFFDDFYEDFSIRVDKKKLLAKAYYYKYLSLLQKPRLSEIGGRVDSDNRLHILIMSPAGSGKGTLRHLETKFCSVNEIELPVASSSISNKEQMIGKVLRSGKGKEQSIIQKKGYLGKKSLFYDESQDVLNENKDKQHSEIMILNRMAMDSYGRNKITKELVDDRPDEVLEYFSPTSITFFAHPTQLSNIFFSRGTARRFSLFFEIEEDVKINVEKYTSLVFEKKDIPFAYFNQFKVIQDSLSDNESIYNPSEYTEESCHIISSFTSSVLHLLLTHKNPKVVRYGILNRNTINLFFLKWINIMHLAKGDPYTKNKEVANILIDSLGFFLNNIQNFIKRGNLENQIPEWSELDEQQIWCLHHLLTKKAINLENSNITIKQFIENVICRIFGVNSRQGWRYYNELKSKGFIKSKQIGKHDSRVWLSRVPDETYLEDYDFTRTEGYQIMKKELLHSNKKHKEFIEIFENTEECETNLSKNIENWLRVARDALLTPPPSLIKHIDYLLQLISNNNEKTLNNKDIPYNIDMRSFKFFFFFNIYIYSFYGGGGANTTTLATLDNLKKKDCNPSDEIKEYISEKDDGEGVNCAKIIHDLNVSMQQIQKLLKSGEIYEHKLNVVRLL